MLRSERIDVHRRTTLLAGVSDDRGTQGIIPLDGSKLVEHSLAYLSALRPLGLTEVELISVIDPVAVPARRAHEDEERERNLLTVYLEKIAEEVRAHTTLEARVKVLAGPAPQAILEEAEAYQPDYLVISTHGSSGLSRWRFGSVADKVIAAPNFRPNDTWTERPWLPPGTPPISNRKASLAACLRRDPLSTRRPSAAAGRAAPHRSPAPPWPRPSRRPGRRCG